MMDALEDHHGGVWSLADVFIDQHTVWGEKSKCLFIESGFVGLGPPPICSFVMMTGKNGVHSTTFGVN